jgi:hypothetical protein
MRVTRGIITALAGLAVTVTPMARAPYCSLDLKARSWAE